MNRLRESAVLAVILLSASIFTGCGVMSYGVSASMQTGYDNDNPQWAPPYYSGARYYYLPDIECYYDLSTRDFIFLNDGRWCYSSNIPSIYAGFDLNNCFSVVLNVNVFQPWMHHQYYLSHYPRYYYRDYYDHSNFPYVRGFNENSRRAIYWKENERHRARSWDDQNLRSNRQFRYSKEDRRQQQIWNNQGNRNREVNRPHGPSQVDRPYQDNRPSSVYKRRETTTSQNDRNRNTNYYGKPIGNSVKVRRQMQNPEQKQTTQQRQGVQKSQGREQKQNAHQNQQNQNQQKKESKSIYRR